MKLFLGIQSICGKPDPWGEAPNLHDRRNHLRDAQWFPSPSLAQGCNRFVKIKGALRMKHALGRACTVLSATSISYIYFSQLEEMERGKETSYPSVSP